MDTNDDYLIRPPVLRAGGSEYLMVFDIQWPEGITFPVTTPASANGDS